MPQAIIAALTPIVGATLAPVLGYGLYIGASYLALQALAPKNIGAGRGLQTNFREATSPHDYVYGQVRKGGTIIFMEAPDPDRDFLHMVIALAGHEVEEIGQIYINDEIVTLDGTSPNGGGFVTSSDWVAEDGTKLIRIKKHLGSSAQNADSDLVAETSVTSAFRGRGIAYIYVRMQYDGEVFSGGIPTFTAVVKGKKVEDPRTSTTAYSANAALCIRDYLISSYGVGDTNVDDTFFSAAANTCDENVTLAGGGTEKRYEINGVVRADETPKQILDKMMTACGGTLYWSGGTWKLRVAEYTSPIRSLDLNDVVSEISVRTRVNRRDSFNAVQGTFVNAADNYITADYNKVASTVFQNEDNGYENVLDFQLPLTTSNAMAERLAKILLYRTREQIQFEADFNLSAYDLEVGDVIQFTNPRYGWVNKQFEVRSWRFYVDQDAGSLKVRMTLQETSSAAYDWNADERDIISNNSILPRYSDGVGITQVGVDDVTITKDGTILYVKDEGIDTDQIAALAVTSIKIGNAAITSAKIDNLAVTNAKIDDLSVGNTKIQDLATGNARYFVSSYLTPNSSGTADYYFTIPFDYSGDAIITVTALIGGSGGSSAGATVSLTDQRYFSSVGYTMSGYTTMGDHTVVRKIDSNGANVTMRAAVSAITNITSPSIKFDIVVIQRYK